MKIFFTLIHIFFVCFVFGAQAEELAIKSRGYFDSRNGVMISGKIILIKDGRIAGFTSKAPAGMKLLDLKETWLLPGLTDCHSHLFLTQTTADKTLEVALVREAKLSDDFRKQRAKIFLQQYLKEGFTSICDLGNSGHYLDAELKKEIQDQTDYPLLYISGPGLAVNKGQFAPDAAVDLARIEYDLIENERDINKSLEEHHARNVDILKIYLDNSPGIGQMSSSQVMSILSHPLAGSFKKITAHSIEEKAPESLLKTPIESVEHFNAYSGKEINPTLRFATLTNIDRKTLEEFQRYNKVEYLAQIFRTKALAKSRIKMVFGPDLYFHKDGFDRGKAAKRTVDTLIEAKLSAVQILQSMTIHPALSLKQDKTIGAIEEGALANFLGVQHHPLKRIRTIFQPVFVMNRGHQVRLK